MDGSSYLLEKKIIKIYCRVKFGLVEFKFLQLEVQRMQYLSSNLRGMQINFILFLWAFFVLIEIYVFGNQL